MTAGAPAPASISFRAGVAGEPVLQDVQASEAHTFETKKWGALLVPSGAHPVTGDHHSIQVSVGAGCGAEMRSSAATIARRGGPRQPWSAPIGSSTEIRVTVASDGMFTWRPEPGVAADSCRHRARAVVDLAASARLLWRDDFLLERRDGAVPGTWTSHLRVVRDGWPVVCTEMAVGPDWPLWDSPAVLGGARAVTLLVVVDPEQPADAWKTGRYRSGVAPAGLAGGPAAAMALPLNGPGLQIVAWGDDLSECRTAMESLVETCGVPEWAKTRWRAGRRVGPIR